MKVRSKLFSVIPMAAAMSVIGARSAPVRPRAAVDAAVYAALIDSLIRPRADTLVVGDSTISFAIPAGGFRGLLDSMPPDLPARLEEVSRVIRPTGSLSWPQPVRVITRAERREIFGADLRGTWEEFLRRFPKQRQWLEFSPVAFSADSSWALVSYRHHGGRLCGGGSVVWLQVRPDGKWAVRKVVGLWAS